MEELLEKGSAIPDVSFRQGREEIHLKDLLGKRFILAFYPAAFTGGWEREIVGFQQNYSSFKEQDVEIIASSADLYFAQKAFGEHCGVEFQMGAGAPAHQMAKAFGVYDERRGSYKRVTFIIGSDGHIQHLIDESPPEDHSQEALEFIQRNS